MIDDRKTRGLLAATLVAAAVAACMRFVDRPLALWLHARFAGTGAFALGMAILRPLDAVLIAGLVLLVVSGAWVRVAARPPAWVSAYLPAGLAGLAALALTALLKLAIGRAQAYPTFLRDHVYEYRPFQASRDFFAFPSATMAVTSAFLAGLGLRRFAARVLAVLVLAPLAVALLVTNGHWAGDILAGTGLGVVTGSAIRRRVLRARAQRPEPAVDHAGGAGARRARDVP